MSSTLVASAAPAKSIDVASEQMRRVSQMNIYFGHQSVGDNIIQGLRDIMASNPDLRLNIVHSDTPPPRGPVFLEFYIGQNRDPQSKNSAFSLALENGAGKEGGVAIYKYCYIDINKDTDVGRLFEAYRSTVEGLKAKYPKLKFVHVTVPLTTVDVGLKSRIKLLLGRHGAAEINAKRNQFNEIMRQAYKNEDAIFDLAEVESTHSRGTRSYVRYRGRTVYTLAPELSSDGGHLNEIGRRAAANKLLQTLAAL